jgi:hypothetical protein
LGYFIVFVLFSFCFVLRQESYCVAQAGPEFLGLGDLSASVSGVVRTISASSV